MTDDDAVEDVGKSMHEAKQRVKETLQAGTADVDSDAAAAADDDDDALADTGLSALGDEAQPSAPATARSITTPTGEVIHDISFITFATIMK